MNKIDYHKSNILLGAIKRNKWSSRRSDTKSYFRWNEYHFLHHTNNWIGDFSKLKLIENMWCVLSYYFFIFDITVWCYIQQNDNFIKCTQLEYSQIKSHHLFDKYWFTNVIYCPLNDKWWTNEHKHIQKEYVIL